MTRAGVLGVLSCTDGSITALLEHVYDERIRARPAAAPELAEQLPDLLDAEAGAGSLRVVDLVGDRSGWAYARAASMVVPDRMPASVRDGLEGSDAPFGTLLRQARLPIFRDIVGCETDGSGRLLRRSRLCSPAGTIAVIVERFDLPPDR